MSHSPKTVVLGASNKPERYSNKAVVQLLKHGHHVIPVHPQFDQIEGLPVVHHLRDIPGPVDTVTLYLSPQISSSLQDDLITLHPRRVIFNPGTENPTLQNALAQAGIHVEEACTLVLLSTGQY